MITFRSEYARDRLDLLDDIFDIEKQYQTYDSLKRELRVFFRGNSRLITAWDDDTLIGFYMYCPASMYTINPKWTELKQSIDVDIEECSVPVFAHYVHEYATTDNYVEFNYMKTQDAIAQGYKYSLIGLNSSNICGTCLQREWIDKRSIFINRSNTQFKLIDYVLENGRPIYLEVYS